MENRLLSMQTLFIDHTSTLANKQTSKQASRGFQYLQTKQEQRRALLGIQGKCH